jgi:hypothetical protein
MATSVFAVATSLQQAGRILADLHEFNIPADEVSVLLPEIGIDENRDFGWLQFEDIHFADLGPYLASGPVLLALMEEGTDNGLWPALIALGLSEDEARHYEEILLDHHILLGVHCSTAEICERVEEIFQRDNAQELASIRN